MSGIERNFNKTRLNVLLVIDQFGWAFDFGARGIKKYSKHNCTIKRSRDVTVSDILNNDVIFCFCSAMWRGITANNDNKQALESADKRIIVGLRASPQEVGEHVSSKIKCSAIACISKETYDFHLKYEKEHGFNRKVYLVHSGVDTEIFKPIIRPDNRFVVGWAGYLNRKVKRTYLLNYLDYPLLMMTNWGQRYFVEGRSRQEMVDFYNKIDAYICVSSAEGFPQVILEAAACGLPIVSTKVGAIAEFLDEEWLISPMPEDKVMAELNRKLKILAEDPELRKKVGQQNRAKCLNTWEWKHIVSKYDECFEGK